jgi:hypothetical protein
MKHETAFLLKTVLGGAAAIVIAALLFFNFQNALAWMTLNDPLQGQFAVVQLSDGEILYGHLAGVTGSTIGLTDVYSLDKVSPESTSTAAPATDAVSSSTGISVLGGVAPAAVQPLLVPVSVASQLFIDRTSVLYFKFVTPNDPALPYLH